MIELSESRVLTPEERPEDEASRFRALISFQDELAATARDQSSLLALTAQHAQQLTGAAGAFVEMREGDDLICRAATGCAASVLGVGASIASCLSGVTFLSGRAFRSDDVAVDPRIDRALSTYPGQRSVLTVPLISNHAPSGVLTVVSPQTHVFADEHRRPLRLLAAMVTAKLDTLRDLRSQDMLVTEHVIALEALRESESRFRHAFDDSGVGMALIATDDRWLRVNPALCRIVGYSAQDLLSGDPLLTTHPDDIPRARWFIDSVLTGQIPTGEMERRYIHKNGSVVWTLFTVSAVKDAAGQTLYLIAQIQDISARKQAEHALIESATRDYLTGLYNRRELVRLLDEEALRASRHQRPLSLIMVDIDSFKAVNDKFGHQAGDRALKHVAMMIGAGVRSFDRVGRYGGEEFAILLPETSEVDALAVAERIRSQIASRTFAIGPEGDQEPHIRLTISMGIATMSTVGGKAFLPDHLVREADARLYAAKTSGKNRCHSTPVPTVTDG